MVVLPNTLVVSGLLYVGQDSTTVSTLSLLYRDIVGDVKRLSPSHGIGKNYLVAVV